MNIAALKFVLDGGTALYYLKNDIRTEITVLNYKHYMHPHKVSEFSKFNERDEIHKRYAHWLYKL